MMFLLSDTYERSMSYSWFSFGEVYGDKINREVRISWRNGLNDRRYSVTVMRTDNASIQEVIKAV